MTQDIKIEPKLALKSLVRQSLTDIIADLTQEYPDRDYFLSEKIYQATIPAVGSYDVRFLRLNQKGPEYYGFSFLSFKKRKPLIEISCEVPLLAKVISWGEDIRTQAFLYDPDLTEHVERHIGKIKNPINRHLPPNGEGEIIYIDIPNQRIADLYENSSNIEANM